MKKAISILLILTTLMGCCTMLFACKKDKNEEGDDAKTLQYATTALLDFNNAGNITANGLSVRTDVVKTATNSASWNPTASKTATFSFAETDLSSYKELSVWINNTSNKSLLLDSVKLVSDNSSTPVIDGYKSNPIQIHPGWHLYNLPFSEFGNYGNNGGNIRGAVEGTPIGFNSISKVVFTAGINEGSFEILFDALNVKTQKFGTTRGFEHSELANAVCFYDENHMYLYNQLRYVLEEGNRDVQIVSDNYTTYVPIVVLAQHRGATITSQTAENVSFTYNNVNYAFTPSSDLTFVGTENGDIPGQAKTVKPKVVGNYLMLPMEYCAEKLGYQLFYDKMGLVIFSDIPEIYDYNYTSKKDKTFEKIYGVIETIFYEGYTGSELLDNMDELHTKEGHTKVLINDAQFEKLRGYLKTDATYASWFRRFEAENADIPTDKLKFVLSDGYRMLDESRKFMNRVVVYAFLYRMTDNEEYAQCVTNALLDMTTFKDPYTKCKSWHPEHSLDLGEILFGYGLAYDWLYDYFDEEDRKTIEKGAWELGYGTVLGFSEITQWWADSKNYENYKATITDKDKESGNYIKMGGGAGLAWYCPGKEKLLSFGVTKYKNQCNVYNFTSYIWSNNFNAVNNGGMVVFALAFANVNDNCRAASEYLLDCANYTIPHGLIEAYAPDGGYPEGPAYWLYGTTYTTHFIQALYYATGTDQGWMDFPGLSESFYYINYISTDYSGVWNYQDCGYSETGSAPSTLNTVFTSRTGDKNLFTLFAKRVENDATPTYRHLMHYDPEWLLPEVNLALDQSFNYLSMSTMRSGWGEDAVFCGLHGGDNNIMPHSHHDLGSFILDFGKTRFFIDMGADDYNLASYKGGGSVDTHILPYGFWYYRKRAEGHNTLVIDPEIVDTNNTSATDEGQGKGWDQMHFAYSKTLDFKSGKTSAYAVVDMIAGYGSAGRMDPNKEGIRGLLLTENRSTVVIQDEFTLAETGKGHTVYWFAHTRPGTETVVSADGKSAIVSYEGKSVLCQIVLPKGAKYDFNFNYGPADYLPETGLTTQYMEYSRVEFGRLNAKGTNLKGEVKFAIVCRLLSDGPHGYEFTDIKDWAKFID